MNYECEYAETAESVKIQKLIQQGWEFVCSVGNYAYFRKEPLVK